MTTIEIIVAPNGETSLETHGFTGVACREASRQLEDALGLATAERLTAEFYETAAVTAKQQSRTGQ